MGGIDHFELARSRAWLERDGVRQYVDSTKPEGNGAFRVWMIVLSAVFLLLSAALLLYAATIQAHAQQSGPSPELIEAHRICMDNKPRGADGTNAASYAPGFESCPGIVSQMVAAQAQSFAKRGEIREQRAKEVDAERFKQLKSTLGVK